MKESLTYDEYLKRIEELKIISLEKSKNGKYTSKALKAQRELCLYNNAFYDCDKYDLVHKRNSCN